MVLTDVYLEHKDIILIFKKQVCDEFYNDLYEEDHKVIIPLEEAEKLREYLNEILQ